MSEHLILKVEHVTKKIGEKQLLSDVCLHIPQGVMFGLLGPNGSGKTTLIRSIVGLVSTNSGDIFINGLSLKENFEEAIKHIGAIVENPEFYPFLTGYQNLKHFANMYEHITEERIQEVISLVNLTDSIDYKVNTYSLGMRQRLGIAQAILHRPKLLILDEPTNGLDPAGIKELRVYLKKLCEEEHVSILIASHLLKEIEELCDQVAIIKSGEILTVKHITSNHENETIIVEVTVDEPNKAKQILGDQNIKLKEIQDGIELELTKEKMAEVNKLLVEHHVKVYFIKPVYKSLEDSFLEWTREG